MVHPQTFLDFGERVASGDLDRARQVIAGYEHDFKQARSVLPDEPDKAAVQAWLLRVRQAYWDVDPVPSPGVNMSA